MYLKPATAIAPGAPEGEPGCGETAGFGPHRIYQRLPEGRHLFHEGDTARHVYEVRHGMLRLARVTASGRRQIVAFGLPGDVVGFPEGDFHHTDCVAICDTVVVAHRLAALTGEVDPHLHRRLTRAALNEICALQDHFLMLSSSSAAEKIASFLLTLAERIGEPEPEGIRIGIAMPRVDIADFLGLTTETVCRTFTQFRRDGLIVLDTAHDVLIRDARGLRARAERE